MAFFFNPAFYFYHYYFCSYPLHLLRFFNTVKYCVLIIVSTRTLLIVSFLFYYYSFFYWARGPILSHFSRPPRPKGQPNKTRSSKGQLPPKSSPTSGLFQRKAQLACPPFSSAEASIVHDQHSLLQHTLWSAQHQLLFAPATAQRRQPHPFHSAIVSFAMQP